MGNLNISTRKERQQGFTARGQPLLYDQWLESCAWSNVGHWSENSIFPYTFYTEAEKNVNRNNFVKKHSNLDRRKISRKETFPESLVKIG